jgi:hypothetical protein
MDRETVVNETRLDFQDSEVSTIELQHNQFIIRFSAAYIHRADNQDDGPGFIQALELTIDQPTIIQKADGCIGRLSHGMLRVAGTTMKHVPIPYEAADVELELTFSNGSICKATGKRIEVKQTGEARVVEWLKC